MLKQHYSRSNRATISSGLNASKSTCARLRAGVVIATGFVNVLGDASFILTDPCLGLCGTYPWAFTFATFALLFTFCLEYFLQRYFRALLGLPQMPGEVLCEAR